MSGGIERRCAPAAHPHVFRADARRMAFAGAAFRNAFSGFRITL
jgi:hypothetical protein